MLSIACLARSTSWLLVPALSSSSWEERARTGRRSPGHLGGKGLLQDRHERVGLLGRLEGPFKVGPGLLQSRLELGRVEAGQEPTCRHGLPLLNRNGQDAAAGLERQVRLHRLDGAGVGELCLPRAALAVVDEGGRAGEQRQNGDDDDAFLQATPPQGSLGPSFHTIFVPKC